MEEKLKVLRVIEKKHLVAKINAVKKGLKMQIYIEKLIEADELNLIDWAAFEQKIKEKGRE
jgi:predicted DNA binding CopG/RHH family protein